MLKENGVDPNSMKNYDKSIVEISNREFYDTEFLIKFIHRYGDECKTLKLVNVGGISLEQAFKIKDNLKM
jgi:hypothetical protein